MKATWVLVCDASRARVFAFEKSEQPWAIVEDIINPAGRARVRDLVEDKAGRAGPGMEPRRDPRELRERLAGELAISERRE